MKLTELLKQITPLPWQPAELNNDKVIPTVRLFGRRRHDQSKAVCFGRLDLAKDAVYACHSANLLPALVCGIEHDVEALYNVPEVGGRYDQQHSDTQLAAVVELKELLVKVADVSLQRDAEPPTTGAFTMQMARTTRETIHGNPGERRILAASTLIVVIPASNLTTDSPIKYWAHPVEGHSWPAETEAWAEDVGVGLHADDVALVKMLAFPIT